MINPEKGPSSYLPTSFNGSGSRFNLPSGAYEKQQATIFDLISAGEIEGLVGGLAGVFLNGTAVANPSTVAQSQILNTQGTCNISGTAVTNAVIFGTTTGLFSKVGSSDTRILLVKGAGASSTLSAAAKKGQTEINVANTGFFTSAIAGIALGNISSTTTQNPIVPCARITGANTDGGDFISTLVAARNNDQVAILSTPLPKDVASGTTIKIDFVSLIVTNSIANSGKNVTVAVAASTGVTAADCLLSGPINLTNRASTAKSGTGTLNYSNVHTNFYTGERYQGAHLNARGSTKSASYTASPNFELKWNRASVTGGASDFPITPSTFPFSQHSAEEVDSVEIDIEFPGGLYALDSQGGDKYAYTEFQIVLDFRYNSSDAYSSKLIAGKNYGGTDFDAGDNVPAWVADGSGGQFKRIDGYYTVGGPRSGAELITQIRSKSPFIKSYTVNLKELQPLQDWKIRVKRLSPETAEDYIGPLTGVSPPEVGGTLVANARVKFVEAIIEEKFKYPLSAYAVTSFSAEDFPSPPERAYHIRGKKVKVPSNYITREEAGSNQAKYTRNITSGADAGSYQIWTGTFRGDTVPGTPAANIKKVYTNNPAWILYDILTDKDVGLGNFLEESDIDKFSLYKIARYCDELVPDGKGGQEPRFTANVYLQKQTEAYKVIKDLSSIFRGMMYWIDGEITFVQDSFKEPVYTFTNGNVVDGIFSYTSTGQRARSNQVNVTWNNPLEGFKQTVLTVEDTAHILKQKRLIPKNISAFGCTSEGQAQRAARWHLITDTKETEMVAFSTGINGAYLRPGDFINVQDHHRDGLVASGRVSSASSTTTVTLDRSVTLSNFTANTSHILYLIYPSSGVYLDQEESATINSVVYKRGSLILTNASGGAINTQSDAANLVDDSGNSVSTQFSENTRIEKQFINSENTASGKSTIDLAQAFTSAPNSEVIWAIGPTNELSTADIQQYRVLAIEEEGDGKYSVSGSIVSIDKYDNIERDEKVYIPDYSDLSGPLVDVPTPSNLMTELVSVSSPTIEANGASYEAIISWSYPEETFTDTAGNARTRAYRFANLFEIEHNILPGNLPGGFSSVSVSAGSTNVRIPNASAGSYKVRIRTVSDLGSKSPWITRNPTIAAPIAAFSRVSNIPKGGTFTGTMTFDESVQKLKIEESVYTYIAPNTIELNVSSATTAQKEINFSSMPSNSTAYLYYDSSTGPANPWKVVAIHTDTVAQDLSGKEIDFSYFKQVGATNNGLTAISGTVSVTIGSSTVTGSGTSFTSDFAAGDLIKVTSGSAAGTQVAAAEYQEVSEVISNTELITRAAFLRTFSGQYGYKQSFKPDFSNDAILVAIQKGSGTSYGAVEFFINTKGKRGAGRWQVPVSTLPTNSTQAQTAWDSTWAERPGSPVTGDQALFFTGTLASMTGQVPFSYDGAAWQIQSEIIDGDLIVTGSVTTDKIFANAITTEKLAANSITANQITANSVVATLITASAVTATDISASNLSAINANLGNITAGTMKNSGANAIPDANSAPSGTEVGGFIDLNQGKFVFGSASKHILWNGTDLTLSGVILSNSNVSLNVTDAGGLGSLTYSSTNSQLTYTGPSNSDVRGLFSVATSGDSDLGQLTYDNTQGQYAFAGPTAATIRGKFSGGNGITYTSGTGAIAVDPHDGISVTSNGVAVDTSVVRTTGAQSIAGNKSFTNNVTVGGDLTVSGTTTTINTDNLAIEDNVILLNRGETGSSVSEGESGIEVDRGSGANPSFKYKETGVGITGDLAAGWTVGTARLAATGFYGTFYGDASNLANINADSLSGLSTADLVEDPSTSLGATSHSGGRTAYFSNQRAAGAVSAGNGLLRGTIGTNGATYSVKAGSGISVNSTGVNVSGITTSMIASGSILIGNETFSDSDSQLMTAAAVNDRILSFSYTTNTGDITRVHAQAGSGLTGTSDTTSGDAIFTFNVGATAGGGISVVADSIGVDSTVVRTSGNQTLAGIKTFSSKISGDIDTVDGYHVHSADRNNEASKIVRTQANGRIYGGQFYANDWFRAEGTAGLYFQTYGGGWYMSDTTWIRSYNNKSIYHNTGILRTDGTLQVGSSGGTMNVPNGGTPTIGGNTILHTGNVSYPTVNNPAITFQRNSSTIATVNLNQSGAQTVNFTDTNTTYSAASGGGLSLNSSNQFSLASTATGGTIVVDLLSANQIQANHIAANSITARELAISNGSSGSAGIYFSTTAMEIHDGTRVRVKIGAL